MFVLVAQDGRVEILDLSKSTLDAVSTLFCGDNIIGQNRKNKQSAILSASFHYSDSILVIGNSDRDVNICSIRQFVHINIAQDKSKLEQIETLESVLNGDGSKKEKITHKN